ncbi:hypothetical protein NT6N_29980 [Oceaniferula spumae]|uniref:Tetratricopeptide repeat protein n=1 Tax=Oceaniferula spumae TaxID=2979115 RepID=A0AAT9FPP5_9BACT
MKSLLAALLIPLTPACIWIDGTTIDGGHVSVGSHGPAYELRESIDSVPSEVLLRYALENKETKIEDDSELEAVADLLEGKTAKAIESLTKLEKETPAPSRYSLAANLGTAYELHGDNRNALKWIKEGIKRNPDAHHGTEWLHQLILETKIELEKNPDYLQGRQVVALPDVIDENTRVTIGDMARPIDQIGDAIFYQLKERLVFVKPTDPVVASLLYSFARITAHTNTVEGGLELLELTREYGFSDLASIEALEKKYERIIFIRKLKKYGIITAGVVAFVLLVVWMYRKKYLFLTQKSYAKHLNQRSAP